MGTIFVWFLLGVASLASAETVPHQKGCINNLGICEKECEEGTHAYTTGCSYLTPEATCDNPNPVEDKRSRICDYSSCYCDPPTVRDISSKKCVKLADCPQSI